MRIKSLWIKEYPPIKNLSMGELGDIVIIAGANGSGKTRLKEAIVQTLQGNPQLSLDIEATKKEEVTKFNSNLISVVQWEQNQILNEYMKSRRFGRGRYVGSLVQIDSQRNIETIKYTQISYQVSDPDDTETPTNWGYQKFSDRWRDFMHYIHQKVAAHKNKLAEEVQDNPTMIWSEILEKFPHPLEKYKEIFSKLLPGKKLQDINPAAPNQFQYKDVNNNLLDFNSLSSGEQEVVKVIFDVARKDIKHSVIIVDEPELHLHPTLTFKLIETLKTVGDHTNQFIFLTHSADLISTYYSTGNVYFIDSEQAGSNQAHRLSELNHSHTELVQLIWENLGLFAVGKKLIFIEWQSASIDKLTFHKISQKYLSEATFIPVGSVENIIVLNTLEEQIRSSIFGIDFYMIRDRDWLSESQIIEIEKKWRIKCLKKRHIENYFLDSDVLLKVAHKLYLTSEKPEITKDYIDTKLNEIATSQVRFNLVQNTKEHLKLNHNFWIPTVKSIETKELWVIISEMVKGITNSIDVLSAGISEKYVANWMNTENDKLNKSLKSGDWKNIFQWKYIFSILCGSVLNINPLRAREAYIDIALEEKPEVFDDIKNILISFE